MNKSPLICSLIAVGSGAVGVFVGYKVAEKRLADQFEKRLAEETKGMRTFYTAHEKKYTTPEAAVADLILPAVVNGEVKQEQEKIAYHKIVKSQEYDQEDDPEEEHAIEAEIGEVSTNIFETKTDPDKPYIISQEEYMQNEPDYNQATLTYYIPDQVLTDEREDTIEDIANTIGEENIQFGVGSSDKNVVHIRNERLGMDFEVVCSQISYAKDVLGMEEDPAQTRKLSRRQRDE